MDIKQDINLRNVKALDFFDALNSGDYSLIAKTEEEFLDILYEYQDKAGHKMSGVELAKHRIKVRVELLSAIGYLIASKHYEIDDEVIDILKNLGIPYSKENEEKALDDMKKAIDRLGKKADKLKINEKPIDNKEQNDAYEILANLSVSLQFDFDYNSISLSKFIALTKALKQKNEIEDGTTIGNRKK